MSTPPSPEEGVRIAFLIGGQLPIELDAFASNLIDAINEEARQVHFWISHRNNTAPASLRINGITRSGCCLSMNRVQGEIGPNRLFVTHREAPQQQPIVRIASLFREKLDTSIVGKVSIITDDIEDETVLIMELKQTDKTFPADVCMLILEMSRVRHTSFRLSRIRASAFIDLGNKVTISDIAHIRTEVSCLRRTWSDKINGIAREYIHAS